MLFFFYYRNSGDSLLETLLWEGTWPITANILIVIILIYVSLWIFNCDYSILPNRIWFSLSMIIIENVRHDANHFSNQTFVLFQKKNFSVKIWSQCNLTDFFTWQSRFEDCCWRCVQNLEAASYTIAHCLEGY